MICYLAGIMVNGRFFNSFLRKLNIFITAGFLSLVLSSKASPIDSLQQLLAGTASVTKRVELNIQLSEIAIKTDFKKALQYAQEAEHAAKEANDPSYLFKAYRNMAVVFYYSGILDKAVTYFDYCQKVANQNNDPIEAFNASINKGAIYFDLKDYQKAKEIFKFGEASIANVYQKEGKEVPLADRLSLYNNLGAICMFLDELGEANRYLQAGLLLADTVLGSTLTRSKLLQSVSIGLIKQKKYPEAIATLEKAKQQALEVGDQAQVVGLYKYLGNAYEAAGKYPQAIEIYKQGYVGALQVDAAISKENFAEFIYKLYRQLAIADSSLKYLKLYEQHQKEVNAIQAKEELLRQDLLSEFSKREGTIRAEEQKKRVGLSYITIIAIIIAVGTGLGLWIYRNKFTQLSLQSYKLTLESEKLELEKQMLQAQIEHKESQLAELQYKLSKNAALDSLVGELQTMDLTSIPLEDTSTPANIAQQGKVWKEFELRFSQLHHGFYDKLLKTCPDLTINERRLCAFLKLDMHTKEISVITGQSVQSINMARFRLRKKLGLNNTETSLFEFLSSL